MGRRDAVQTALEVVAECRRLLPGLLVTWEPGWETRGNGTSANYDFGNIHHTASASSPARPFPTQNMLRAGRSDLPGPLCNAATPWCTVQAPRLHIVAAHPANHAGASRASGPVPALALYNPRTLGNEIDYAGSTPMSDGQRLVGIVWTRAVANVLARGNVEHVRAHAETSRTGKWDPGYAPGKTIDMTAWRRDAANLTTITPGGFLMALSDAEQREVLERLRRQGDVAERVLVEFMGPYGKDGRSEEKGHEVLGPDGTPTRRTLAQLAMEVWRELTQRLPSRVPDSEYADTVLGYAANADAYGNAAIKELGGLRSLLEGLLQKLSDGGQVDVEEFRAMLREELPKLDVEVSIRDTDA